MQEVEPALFSPGPNNGRFRHQRFNEFPPVKHYIQQETEGYWTYHPDLDNLTEGKKGSLGWMFDNALPGNTLRSEEHTSELHSLMRISYAVFCLKKKNIKIN